MADLSDITAISQELTATVPTAHQRFLVRDINWQARLVGVTGGRGVGKTTLLLQALAEARASGERTLYVSADHIKVEALGIYDLAATFFKEGGTILAVDEIHKRSIWPREVKSLYDSFPRARIWFSGSSALRLQLGKADLSRRAVYYSLPVLSFREYLLLETGVSLGNRALGDLLEVHERISFETVRALGDRPLLGLFREYLEHGAYPFFLEGRGEYLARLRQVVEKVLFEDIPTTTDMKLSNVPVLKKILYEIATSPPYEVSIANMSRRFEVSRTSIYSFLYYLEQAGLTARVMPQGAGSTITTKPAKLFYDNTNLLRAVGQSLSPSDPLGTVRETFFVSQLTGAGHQVRVAPKGDFLVDDRHLFEIGGKGKGRRQIAGERDGYVVRDDTESGFGKTLPLWIFGMLY